MRRAYWAIAILVLLISGCQLFYILDPKKGSVYSMMKTTTPVVSAGAARSLNGFDTGRALESTHPNYPIYYIFQDYVFPDDEGKIDSGNLYKLLHESSNIFVNRRIEAKSITATAIASPFDFGNPSKTFSNAFNSIAEQGGNYDYTLAYKITGDVVDACYGYTVRESVSGGVKTQRQVYETTFNEKTGDITLDFATFDDKPGSSTDDFGRRAFITGNMISSTFFIHFVTGTGSPVVGKGISLGEGYYILCRVDAVPVYYRLPAGATEANFRDVAGVTDISLLDDPRGYARELQTYLKSAEFTTRQRIPTSLESFTNNGLLALP